MYALLVAGSCCRSTSVVDLAYERIRELVLDGEIAPGARLAQVELAERLGHLAYARPRGAAAAERRGPRRLQPQPRLPRRRPRARRGPAPAGGPAPARAGHRPTGRRAPHRRRPRRAQRRRSPARRRPAPASPPTTPAASSTSRSPAPPATRSTSASSTRSWLVEVGRRLLARRATTTAWQDADVDRAPRDRRRGRPATRDDAAAPDGGPRPRRRPATGKPNVEAAVLVESRAAGRAVHVERAR